MIHFEIPKNQSSIIKVIGVGGGGSNAVNYMYDLGIDGVDFIVCNTDSQALALSPIPNKIQLGPHLTQGLGAGANPEIGMKASEESLDDITKILKVNTRMAFITAGMGGGTGTGGAPVVSKICRDLGILTVGIVTMPFSYEGRKRMKQAQEGIERMRDHVDTILIISNDKLRQQFGNLPFTQAFAKADDILATAAKCITDVINTTGQINVDFADVCTVMKNGGVAILGSARVAGESRALEAVEQALNSPLLNDNDISGAKWILLNITSSAGEFEHTMDEAEAIQAFVQQQAGDSCDVILGMGHDPNLGDKIAVTIIATGFNHRELKVDMPARKSNEPEKIVVSLDAPVQTVTAAAPTELKIQVKEAAPDPMAPTLVEMPAATVTAPTYVEKQPQPIIPVIEEAKETYNLQVYEKPAPQEEPQLQATEAKAPENDIQLIIKNEEAKQTQPEAALKAPSGRPLTEWEIEEKRRFEEQKRALEERAERLRSLSFNNRNNNADSADDMENVPAYMRRNMNLNDNASKNGSADNFYSSYSVGINDQQQSKGFIQTINTFLEGKKPD